MKKILFIFLILLSSCSWDEDLNNYHNNLSKSQEYFWYYNNEIFINADSIQLVGEIKSETSTDVHYINRSFKVYNDTIYIKRRNIYPSHRIYNGIIIINKNEYDIYFILQ